MEDKHIDIGNEKVTICKLFGPMIFMDIRISADVNTNTWLIERSTIKYDKDGGSDSFWIEWVRIPGQIDLEFQVIN